MNLTPVTTQEGTLVFDETDGKHDYILYTSSGSRKLTSVTTVIKSFFQPFDQDAIAEKVVSSVNNWDDKTEPGVTASWNNAGDQGKQLHLEIEHFLIDGRVNDPPHEDFYRFRMFWDSSFGKMNPISANYSNSHHQTSLSEKANQILTYHNNLHHKPSSSQLKNFAYFPEFKVFDSQVGISGTMDCLLAKPTGEIIILDWKRSRLIRERSFKDPLDLPKMGKYPFDKFEDCNYSHYALQLNFYRMLLERYYTINNRKPVCIGMFLVVFSPGLAGYETYNVPYIPLDNHWGKEIHG